jgi:Alanyl-tRNA synthetase
MIEAAKDISDNIKEHSNPAMHTAEHILNQTMIRIFGCERSKNSHIERKKSKCDYFLSEKPGDKAMEELENGVNEVIKRKLPVTIEYMPKEEAASVVDFSKLPDNVGDTIRIVCVGDYDACACVGAHVTNTSEIGKFKLISHDYTEGRLRLRFKLTDFE